MLFLGPPIQNVWKEQFPTRVRDVAAETCWLIRSKQNHVEKIFSDSSTERKIFGIPKQPEMDADCRDLLANERSEEEGGPGKEGAANLIWTNYFLLHHQQRKQEKLEQIGGKFEKAPIPIPSMQCRR